jgi:TetR/AcrR family transcriptional regulator, regulator of biofilm formation and stress response
VSASRDRGEATRARILQATAALIAEDGWSGFSTRDIAARAGVTQGVVSYHWRSKDDLVQEAALGATAESLEPISAALREAPSVREALERSLALVEAIRAEPALTLLLFETMLHAARDERLRDALAGMIRDFRGELAAALAREGVAGAEPLAAALSAAWDGLLLHAVVDDELDVADAGAALLRLL